MRSRRLLALGADNAPVWVHLYIQRIGDRWAAMLVADGVPPPEPGTLKGLAFFDASPEEAEQGGEGVRGVGRVGVGEMSAP